MFSKLSFTCLLLVSSAIVYAQEQAPPEPSPSEAATEHEPPKAQPAVVEPAKQAAEVGRQAAPRATIRQVPINIDEGTLDERRRQPDGARSPSTCSATSTPCRSPAATPTRIAEGLAYEQQPRFSPDGTPHRLHLGPRRRRQYLDHERRRRDKRQVTKEDFRLLNQPTWSPDGRFIAAKKHFTTGALARHRRDLALPCARRRRRAAGQARRARSSRRNSASRCSRPTARASTSPATSPPARSSNMPRIRTPTCSTSNATTSPPARRTAVPRAPAARCGRRPRPTARGSPSSAASGPSRSCTSRTSPRGEERKIYDALDQDVQETWAVTGVYPNMAWTPDSPSIVFWAGGKMRRVDADGGGAREIPFRVNDTAWSPTRPIRRSRSRPAASRPRCRAWRSVARRPPGGVREPRQIVGQAVGGRRLRGG